MSKSLGNVYLLKDIIQKGYNPLVYKLFSYSCHYRNKLNFTWEGIEATSKSLERVKDGYQKHLEGTDNVEEDVINVYEEKFHKAINDDLNMPLAMGTVWEVVRETRKSPKFAQLLLKFDTVLGLKIDEKEEKNNTQIPEEIIKLAEKRQQARQEKNWAESDKIREEIAQKGYTIEDTKDGYKLNKK